MSVIACVVKLIYFFLRKPTIPKRWQKEVNLGPLGKTVRPEPIEPYPCRLRHVFLGVSI